MNLMHLIVPAAAAAGFLVLSPCLGQCTPKEVQKLNAPDGEPSDYFGNSVAIDGDTAVVGAYQADNPGMVDSGAAYVFVRDQGQWVFQARLSAPDGKAVEFFGRSVAIDGDTAVIGAENADGATGSSGAAYVFVRSVGVWTQQAKLTAPDGKSGDGMGLAVAIRGDTVVAGAPWDNTAGKPYVGSVHVFERTGNAWSHTKKLRAPDESYGMQFGVSVAMSAQALVIGANAPYNDAYGSVYVFAREPGGWTEKARLAPPGANPGDDFGSSVAIDGATLMAGALRDNTAGLDTGSVHVFEGGQDVWNHVAEITDPDPAEEESFGKVALQGDVALAGAPGFTVGIVGSAVLMTRTGGTWAAQTRFTASDGAMNDGFGGAIAMEDGTALIGADGADGPGGQDSGLVYVFEYDCAGPCSPADCDGSGALELFDYLCFVNQFNAGDPAADCDGSGTLDLFDFLCFTNVFNAGC